MENKRLFVSPVCTIVDLDDADVLTVSDINLYGFEGADEDENELPML